MWGSDQAPDGTAVAIGTQCADTSTTTCDPIAWKAASDDSDDVVWGSAGVWATSMGSENDNIVWGTSALDRTDNILWGAPAARRRVRLVVAGPPTR
jgi:hypothetical protein